MHADRGIAETVTAVFDVARKLPSEMQILPARDAQIEPAQACRSVPITLDPLACFHVVHLRESGVGILDEEFDGFAAGDLEAETVRAQRDCESALEQPSDPSHLALQFRIASIAAIFSFGVTSFASWA